jgi:NADPH:quinone reductase-like Zn-dependent oxidoreductase
MRAAVITRRGNPVAQNVRLVADWSEAVAAPGQVVVRTQASALNHLDLWVGRGVPGAKLDFPRITGADACGVVESVGAGVDETWIGRCIVLNAAVPQPQPNEPEHPPAAPDLHVIGEHISGSMAERFACPASNIVAIGEEIDAIEAAAFGLVHVTAWNMLVTHAGLTPGRIVLITGIGGGVAQAALNICRHLACTTIVTSRQQWKLDRALELGADHAVLDEGDDWSSKVRAFTHKRGVDVCVDSIGAAVHQSCLKSLARGGAFVTCGCTSGPIAETDLARIFWNRLRFYGTVMGDMNEFRQVAALFSSGRLKPAIDSVFETDDVAQAYARLESGEHFGKVVVRW